MFTHCGHNDEILDVTFNTTGSKLVTASADGNARVYNTMTGACQAILAGHDGEISKVAFSPQGSRVLTASSGQKARIWETDTGDCLQVLEGHTDEIFHVPSIMRVIQLSLAPRTTPAAFGSADSLANRT